MKNYRSEKWKLWDRWSAFAKAGIVSAMLLISCADKATQVVKVHAAQKTIDSTLQKAADFEEFIAPYKQAVDAQMEEQLSYNPVSMHKNDYKLNTPISNMMATILRVQGTPVYEKRTGKQIDIVLLNHGGIRAPLNAGAVTMRAAYEIMPFENEIVVAQLSSLKLRELVDYLVEKKRAHPIDGLQIILNNDFSLKQVLVHGQAIEEGKTYHVATNDYLYNGGDNMSFFEGTPVTNLDYKIRNAMIDYFKKTDTLKFVRDDRFIISD